MEPMEYMTGDQANQLFKSVYRKNSLHRVYLKGGKLQLNNANKQTELSRT